MFGPAPSFAAEKALVIFAQSGVRSVLELGAGQGRDSLFFARRGLELTCLDYSGEGLRRISEKAAREDLDARVAIVAVDLRRGLPLADSSFDACYSHMLYSMDFTTGELKRLCAEIRRVLKPGGLNIFTVRHTGDPHFGKGRSHGDNRFEADGFVVHFLGREDITALSVGFQMLDLIEFEEGELPRKLFLAVQKKNF